MVKPQSNRMAAGALVLITLIWSYNWIVAKSVTHYIGAYDFAALRSMLGAVFLFVVLRIRGGAKQLPPFKPTLAIGLLQTAGMIGFSQWALTLGGAGKVAVLTYTMPFWVILLAALFLNERIRPFQYGVVALALTGLMLVLQPWSFSSQIAGSVLAILAGLCWGGSVVVTKRLYARYPGVDLLTLTTWQTVLGALVLAVIALSVPQPSVVWEPYLFFALGYNAILATAIAWMLWLFVLKTLPAGVASLSTLAIPVSGVLLSWWLLGEQPDDLEWVGMVLIVAALGAISFSHRQSAGRQTA